MTSLSGSSAALPSAPTLTMVAGRRPDPCRGRPTGTRCRSAGFTFMSLMMMSLPVVPSMPANRFVDLGDRDRLRVPAGLVSPVAIA